MGVLLSPAGLLLSCSVLRVRLGPRTPGFAPPHLSDPNAGSETEAKPSHKLCPPEPEPYEPDEPVMP